MDQERYYFRTKLALPFNLAVKKTREALAAEGFGIITEIDVKATLNRKLDVDFRPYVILGACIPSLAHKALQADDQIGLLLPCNVVVQEREDGSEVSALNPEVAMEPVKITKVKTAACEAARRLRHMVLALEKI